MDSNEPRIISCGIDEEDRRLDRIIRKNFISMPLSLIQKAIRTGMIRVNGRKKELGYRLRKGDEIIIPRSIFSRQQNNRIILQGSDETAVSPVKKTSVLLENRHLLFINKERGILVHGKNSLSLQVLAYLGYSPENSSSFTPGPLHRLDRNTSGIIGFGKTAPGARYFSTLLREEGVDKYYIAVVDGVLKAKQEWRDYISRNGQEKKSYVSKETHGKEGSLSVQPLLSAGGTTLVLIQLFTGLTHQIRVQCAFHGHPLSGDNKYGGSMRKGGFLLHAYALHFKSPGDYIATRTIQALPDRPTQDYLRLTYGVKTADALFTRIDGMIQT